MAAVLVGLDHGLGKTQDLLRQSELTKASRVSDESKNPWLLLLNRTGHVCRTNTIHSFCRRSQSLDHLLDDETV